MKNLITKGTVATAMLMLVTFACKDKFLEVPGTGALAGTQLTSKAGLNALLVGAYAQLNGRGFSTSTSSNNWVRGSISGGDANKGSNSGDFNALTPFETYQLLPSSGEVNAKWLAMYEGISRVNSTLRSLTSAGADVTTADKASISGEARFLRGHYFFELKRSFNMVPYLDETTAYGSGIEAVPNNVDIWAKIETDFKYAMDNLPATQSAVGRANKWAAAAYLAKTYLYQKKYAAAKTLFDQIIASGTTAKGVSYALLVNFQDNFNADLDNGSESVFAIQAAANAGSSDNANPDLVLNFPYNTNAPAGCCGFFQPSFELANSFRVNTNGLPLLDGSYNLAANALKTDQGIKSDDAFTSDASPVDPRLDWSIGRRGIPYLDWGVHPGLSWIRDQSFGGPYSPIKFVFYKAQDHRLTDNSSWTDGYSAINYNIIRYSDVLLMAAECEVEAGSLATALNYVNLVRNRAKATTYVKTSTGDNAANYQISPYTAFADKTTATNAIRFERKLELSGEGHRFYDLVRWGIAATTLNAFVAYEGKLLPTAYSGANFTAGKDEYMPIPQTQIDSQGKSVLTQNSGY